MLTILVMLLVAVVLSADRSARVMLWVAILKDDCSSPSSSMLYCYRKCSDCFVLSVQRYVVSNRKLKIPLSHSAKGTSTAAKIVKNYCIVLGLLF